MNIRGKLGRIAGQTSLTLAAVAAGAIALAACNPLPGAPGGSNPLPVKSVKAPISLHTPTIGDFAPTPELGTLANIVQFHLKSVSSEISISAGQNLPHPVDVTVSYPVGDATKTYSKDFGVDWTYQFPENGGNPTPQVVTVTFVEHISSTKTETFSRTWNATVEPLYNFTVSPLLFTLIDDCDTFGDSEVKVQYADATGATGNFHVDTSAGNTTTFAAFAKRYTEIGASANLREPGVSWLEHDVDLGEGDAPGPVDGFNLATHPYTFSYNAVTHDDNGQSCRGRLQYSLIKSPVITYGF